MANRNIVAIGTSAGGVEALLFLARSFPVDFPAAVVVTIHLSHHFRSELDAILTRVGALPACFAQDGAVLKTGQIYIAPPGCHLLVDGDRMTLGNGPRENNARPAIDPMMRSAAICCGGRAIGVMLTGTLGDGASGLWALKLSGGVTVVQDPSDAAFGEMPQTALDRVRPEHIVPLADMPALLQRLVNRPASPTLTVPDWVHLEVEVARNGHSTMDAMDRVGQRSALTCPDCGGVMWQINEEGLVRYRCHLGHAFLAEAMELALDEGMRRALESARRGHRERVRLMEELESHSVATGNMRLAEKWHERAEDYKHQAQLIDDLLERLDRLKTHSKTHEGEPAPSETAG